MVEAGIKRSSHDTGPFYALLNPEAGKSKHRNQQRLVMKTATCRNQPQQEEDRPTTDWSPMLDDVPLDPFARPSYVSDRTAEIQQPVLPS